MRVASDWKVFLSATRTRGSAADELDGSGVDMNPDGAAYAPGRSASARRSRSAIDVSSAARSRGVMTRSMDRASQASRDATADSNRRFPAGVTLTTLLRPSWGSASERTSPARFKAATVCVMAWCVTCSAAASVEAVAGPHH